MDRSNTKILGLVNYDGHVLPISHIKMVYKKWHLSIKRSHKETSIRKHSMADGKNGRQIWLNRLENYDQRKAYNEERKRSWNNETWLEGHT